MISEENYSARAVTDCCIPKPNQRMGELQRWVDAWPSTQQSEISDKEKEAVQLYWAIGFKNVDLKKHRIVVDNFPFSFHIHKTINKTEGEPVQFWFAGELESVVFVHSGTEDQIELQPFLWEQSAKSITGLDVYKLQFSEDNTA